jgi:hypothetical protein
VLHKPFIMCNQLSLHQCRANAEYWNSMV